MYYLLKSQFLFYRTPILLISYNRENKKFEFMKIFISIWIYFLIFAVSKKKKINSALFITHWWFVY